jgi:hypothetical protein
MVPKALRLEALGIVVSPLQPLFLHSSEPWSPQCSARCSHGTPDSRCDMHDKELSQHSGGAQIDGMVQKLKVPRALEEEELTLFTSQRDNELRHVARALASHRCDDGGACAAAAAAAAASAAQRLRAAPPVALFATRVDDADGDENATGVVTVPVATNATAAALLLPLLPIAQLALRFETCAVVGNRCEPETAVTVSCSLRALNDS